MKQSLSLFLLVVLSSCVTVESTKTPIVENTRISPTNTIPAPTSFPPTPPTIASTTKPPCDPLEADYCILDGHFIFQRPVHPPANDLVDETYLYGSTANGTRDPHHGVEFPNLSGTPVYAAAEGTVVFAGPDKEAVYCPWPNFYGNLVVLQHKDGLFTIYAHLSEIDVEAGQVVGAATQIGKVGRTGVAIGSHLHFEVRSGNVQDYFATQNPQLWLMPARDADGKSFGTLSIAVTDGDGKLVKNAKYTVNSPPLPSQETKNYYGETYSADMLKGEENAVLGELPAGRYRIAIERYGAVYERWVEVESGKLTQVVFIVK